MSSNWQISYDNLTDFVHVNKKWPRRNSKNQEEKKLALWVSTQKNNYRKDLLGDEKIYLLEKIEDWKWKKDSWYESFVKVGEYYQKNNRYPSRSSTDKEEKKLALWIYSQKQNRFKIDPKKVFLLESLPKWFWSREDRWFLMYFEIFDMIKKGIQINYRTETKNFHEWVQKQIREFDNLNVDQKRMIEELQEYLL